MSTSLSLRKLRLGVLGYGRMGELHAGNVAALAHTEVVAVCDHDPAALRRAQMRHGVMTFTDANKFMSVPMDGVIIASSSESLAQHAAAAADAGLHMFVEKPVALSTEDIDRVFVAVRRANVAFQVGFQRRWDPRYRRVRAIIDSGDIGDPILLNAHGRDPDASRLENWGLSKNGGLFVNCAIHDYDVARYLLSREVDRLAATGAVLVHGGLAHLRDLDVCTTSLFFGSKAMAVLEWSRFSPTGFDAAVEVIGTKGSIHLTRGNGRPLAVLVGRKRNRSVMDFFGNAYASSIEAFVTAVLGGMTPSPGIEDARTALYLAKLARRSYENGGAVLPAFVPPSPAA